ncbi:MAG: hypothetical protein A2521_03390 [Deltaproteobacteria bacterium RIFOXYD12_FULL_57_12]|nr:MAG: hypothetical protein A2521_03390 [Deltaproteobacteria bacterium RIFOXYD12_FULL_57_12]
MSPTGNQSEQKDNRHAPAPDLCEACGASCPAAQLIWKPSWEKWVCQQCQDEDDNCGCSD